MNAADEQWRWVDEDPIEKLLHSPLPAAAAPQPPSTAAAFLAAGQEQFEQLRFEEAAGSYTAAVAADPGNPTAHFDLAVCLEKTEQWKAASASFRRAIDLNIVRAEAFIGLGACLLHLGNAGEALDWFNRGLDAGADHGAALLGKAVALQKLQRDEASAEVYSELLRLNPNSAEPLANLIALSVARQDPAATYAYARRLLRVHPQSKAALQGLATLALRNGDAAAVDYCRLLVEVDPDSFEGWFNLRFAQQRLRPERQPARSIA